MFYKSIIRHSFSCTFVNMDIFRWIITSLYEGVSFHYQSSKQASWCNLHIEVDSIDSCYIPKYQVMLIWLFFMYVVSVYQTYILKMLKKLALRPQWKEVWFGNIIFLTQVLTILYTFSLEKDPASAFNSYTLLKHWSYLFLFCIL